jgi:hypothetical protein
VFSGIGLLIISGLIALWQRLTKKPATTELATTPPTSVTLATATASPVIVSNFNELELDKRKGKLTSYFVKKRIIVDDFYDFRSDSPRISIRVKLKDICTENIPGAWDRLKPVLVADLEISTQERLVCGRRVKRQDHGTEKFLIPELDIYEEENEVFAISVEKR